jgi:hypothetical protein
VPSRRRSSSYRSINRKRVGSSYAPREVRAPTPNTPTIAATIIVFGSLIGAALFVALCLLV